MTRLIWGDVAVRTIEAGVDRGVLYPVNGVGVAWNGLVAVKESPSTLTESIRYFDGEKYRNRSHADSFAGTIEALTYPDEFAVYDGYSDSRVSNQRRKTFGLSYRTRILGADGDLGYKLHLVYNALVQPSGRAYSSLATSTDPENFAWDFTTTPMRLSGLRPTAHVVIDSTVTHAWTMTAIEDLLYGTGVANPRLPTPEELIELFESGTILRIIDHGDGTWTATGPDEAIQMLDATTFQISWPTAVYIDEVTFQISSR